MATRVANTSPGSSSTGMPVDGGQGGAGHHVRRARPDRGRAREGLQPVAHARVPHGRVHHRLLVARLVVPQPGLPSPHSSSACPIPATLPWPKIPSSPRRTAARGRRAPTTGRPGSAPSPDPRSVSSFIPPLRSSAAGGPLPAPPKSTAPTRARGRRRQPCPLGRRAGHHVEVVQVVAGCGHRRAVPAVRHQHRVPGSTSASTSIGRSACRRPAGRPSRPGRPRSSRSPPGRIPRRGPRRACAEGRTTSSLPESAPRTRSTCGRRETSPGYRSSLTCRLARPAPRTSTGTPSARP